VPPTIVWGVGLGLVIAAVDAVAAYLIGTLNPREWPVGDIDLLINIALYALIGFRVGKATGMVRAAAEAGVLAGVIVGVISLGIARIFPVPVEEMDANSFMIYQIASNVVYGGLLGIMAGWFGSRASQSGPPSRR
jgi:hypothetical protein